MGKTNKGKKYKDRHNDKRRIAYFLVRMPEVQLRKLLKKIGFLKEE